MKKKTILQRAVEKAVKNGFKFNRNDFPTQQDRDWYQVWIFNHDFAKAIWGKKFNYFDKYNKEGVLLGESIWEHHLQQMVLEKNPIKYLEKFI